MRHVLAPLLGALLFLTLAQGARAELVNWSYTWSSIPDIVEADAPGTGKIYLDKQATGKVEVSLNDPETDIVATNIRTESTASPTNPDIFTNAPFQLTLRIRDSRSLESEDIVFRGVFNGKLTAKSSRVRPTILAEDLVQSVKLGSYIYTVRITDIVNPGPPTSTNQGSIGARAVVAVRDINKVPEPGALISGLLGVGILWMMLARRRPLISF